MDNVDLRLVRITHDEFFAEVLFVTTAPNHIIESCMAEINKQLHEEKTKVYRIVRLIRTKGHVAKHVSSNDIQEFNL